jgi:hypothetical protein
MASEQTRMTPPQLLLENSSLQKKGAQTSRLLLKKILLTASLLAALAAAFLLGISARPGRASVPQKTDPDAALVRSLLGEKLAERSFAFAIVAEACSGKKVFALDPNNLAHSRVTAAIHAALEKSLIQLNSPDSPIRKLRRINEASKFFEDAIRLHLGEISGITCGIPLTRSGQHQRSGYPDLRLVDTASGLIFYLDPKLVEQGSAASTFRSFYFEPKDETLKITDDAVHLLIGIQHNGHEQAWHFTGWQLVDLSTLRVHLKAEFQASNAQLYEGTSLGEN